MQLSVKGSVEQPLTTRSKFQLCYLVHNKIGDEGCSHISKANWIDLFFLNLGISYGI